MNDNLLTKDFEERDISQRAESTVTQQQKTCQENINVQKDAIAIAKGGSFAAAIQDTRQVNENRQKADSAAKNFVASGLEENDEVKKNTGNDDDKTSVASIVQNQIVEQCNLNRTSEKRKDNDRIEINDNDQKTSSLAKNGKKVPKVSNQVVPCKNPHDKELISKIKDKYFNDMEPMDTSQNEPEEEAEDKEKAPSPVKGAGLNQQPGCCSNVNSEAAARVTQQQTTRQSNFSLQEFAVAIAIGPNSIAKARQIVEQENTNVQNGNSSAQNVAKVPCCASTSAASLASNTQVQDVNQTNSSSQGFSMAISIAGGMAEATQSSSQSNSNNQSASSLASTDIQCGDASGIMGTPLKEDKKVKEKNQKDPYHTRAEAKTSEMGEKAVIAIDRGSLKVNIQITDKGIYLNGNKVALTKAN